MLDPVPPRRLEPERLEILERGDPVEIVRAIVHTPVTGRELQGRGILTPAELAAGLASVRAAGEHYFSAAWLDELRATRAPVAERARTHPLDPGVPLAELFRTSRGRRTS